MCGSSHPGDYVVQISIEIYSHVMSEEKKNTADKFAKFVVF